MDEKADACDDQQHDAGEWIDQEAEVDLQIATEEPSVRDDGMRRGIG